MAFRPRRRAPALWVLGLIAAPVANAQAPVANTEAEADDSGLVEIIVTAQRREEGLMTVPLSITAMSADQLTDAGLRDVASLQQQTPGMSLNNGSGYTQIYIRGVGNSIFVGADPSVATFIDDVPRIYGSMVNTFVNVERVEVLKGAQGGLYGRNATGGVVNIVTRKPSDVFSADGKLSYGSDDTFEAAAYLNLPLSDSLAWNLSAQRNTHDSYVKNVDGNAAPYTAAMFPAGSYLGTPQQTADFFNSGVNPPDGLAEQDFYALDSKLKWTAGDRFELLLAADYAKKNDDVGTEITQTTPDILLGTMRAIFASFGIQAELPDGFYTSTDEDFATTKGSLGFVDLRDGGLSATATLHLDGFDLSSISAWRKQETDYQDDLGAASAPSLLANVTNRKRFAYQELRLISTGEGPISLLGGASYLYSRFHNETLTLYMPPLFTSGATESLDRVRNASAYLQVGYDYSDALNLTLSGRYIHEKNEAQFSQPVESGSDTSVSKFLPSATLSYRLATGGTAYARYARGIKTGGVNPIVPPSAFPSELGSSFGPEKIDTYEIGLRSPLAGSRAQFTAAAFYNDYSGLQTVTNGNFENPQIVQAIINAGSAESYGFETSLQWRIAPPLTIGASGGWLHAEYTDFANTDDSVLSTFDFSGKRMIQSPEWQFAFNANLAQPVSERLELTGSLLTSFMDDTTFFNASFPGAPDPAQKAYWLTNLRLGLRTLDGRYSASVFANNVFDEGYVTFGSSSAVGNVIGWGTPRVVGLELGVHF